MQKLSKFLTLLLFAFLAAADWAFEAKEPLETLPPLFLAWADCG